MGDHVWLIGMMGAGKSAVGEVLAARLGRQHFDTDGEIEKQTGCAIVQLWEKDGEATFRSLEAVVVTRLMASEAAVISVGGGAVLDPLNVAAMRQSGTVVWLSASVETLKQRITNGTTRPLLGAGYEVEHLAEILASRFSAYSLAADVMVATDNISPELVVDRIEESWSES